MTPDLRSQYICHVCGCNMVGYLPDHYLFCGAPKERFHTMEENIWCSQVRSDHVKDWIFRLNSVPVFRPEHAARAWEKEQGILWIHAPSSLSRSLFRPQKILFTHPHFPKASNLNCTQFGATTLFSETQEGGHA